MGTECCACPPFPVPRGAPSVPAVLCLSAQSWSMDWMFAHGKAEVGWLQAGHTGTLSSSSQSQLPSTPWLCSRGGVRQVAPHGPQTLSARAPAGWGSQVPDPSDSPCCHRVVRCQGCCHCWVTRVGERGETVGLDTGTWDCCPLPVPVGCRTEGDLDTPPSGAGAWPELLLPTVS